MSSYLNGWYVSGESVMDTIVKYDGRKSLLLSNPGKDMYAGYYIHFDDIDGDSISFLLVVEKESPLSVSCIRSGKEYSVTLPKDAWKNSGFASLSNDLEEKYELASKSVAYINMNTLPDDSIHHFMEKNKNAKLFQRKSSHSG